MKTKTEIQQPLEVTPLEPSQDDLRLKPKTEVTKVIQYNTHSHIPILSEIERFYQFLNTKFNLGLPQEVVFTLAKSHENNLGHFALYRIKNSIKTIHQINLNTLHLQREDIQDAYETIAHEIAHYYNFIKSHEQDALRVVKDASSNGYHNKLFKATAEKLLLGVKEPHDFRGFSYTYLTDEFKEMLKEFKPNLEVWNMRELTYSERKTGIGIDGLGIDGLGIDGLGIDGLGIEPPKKKQSRKYSCPICHRIVRASYDDLDITCNTCETKYTLDEPKKKGEGEK